MAQITLGLLATAYLETHGLEVWSSTKGVLMTSGAVLTILADEDNRIDLRYKSSGTHATLSLAYHFGEVIMEDIIMSDENTLCFHIQTGPIPHIVSTHLFGKTFNHLVQGQPWMANIMAKEIISFYEGDEDGAIFESMRKPPSSIITLLDGHNCCQFPDFTAMKPISRYPKDYP